MTSPILSVPGAVPPPEETADPGVPWHFGDPFAEQRTATRSAAVVDRSHREVIAVPGVERLSWLHLVISQHVSALPAGAGSEALILDSQGRVDAHMVLSHVDDVVWLDTEAGASTVGARGGRVPLLEYLEQMRFWSKVEPRDATAEKAVLTIVGPEAPQVLARLGLPAPEGQYASAERDGVVVRRMPWPGPDAADLLVPRADLADWWARITDAGARPMGSLAFEALRVEALRPRMGVDTDEKTIPHEVSWVPSAAHVAKGCYRGQETVSKVHNIGRPPRRMVLLHLDGAADELPETGAPVLAGERVVGRVGSAVQHHELGPVALALLKRSVDPATPLTAGAAAAAVDPDSVPAEIGGAGRAAAQGLRG
ncbi:CAF17-like 4Fe-4S cluster assembly/insertion protein YgfZ [Actinokineospora fastidiosa]|uniref:Glycine cleavage system protein T n=1 Tax=Actinokineospora fastidiosa TaxID=1816 RepID=A0A918L8Y7_9PSEU|nr:folate-binding protein [Actinokineospora fastidiosa]GGS20871.1 glycine cleavage system protein T [Actinokineospora fastidiosa]